MVAEGDKVVVRFTIGGTHRAQFMGVPATGKRGDVTAIDIMRFQDGKIVDPWGEVDFLGMLQQLGDVPRPGQAPAGA